MRFFFALILISTSYFAGAKNFADTLKNSTIIKMTTSKLGDNLILSSINKSPVKFDISPDAMIALKKAGVSDVVIESMVKKQSEIDEQLAQNLSNNSTGGKFTFTKSGIYFGKEGEKFTKLDPTLTTSSYKGIYFPKFVYSIDGKTANYSIKKDNEIYFNFIPSKKDLNSTNNSGTPSSDYMDAIMTQISGTNVAISPNEFKLVQLKTKRNSRIYEAGSNLGQVTSIKGKYIINFKYEQVSEYTYRIILPADILPGEYSFVYLSKNTNILVKQVDKAFDFRVE
jgi:hypothetical protein